MDLNATVQQLTHQATLGPQLDIFALAQWLQSHHIFVRHVHRNAQTLWDQSRVEVKFEAPDAAMLTSAHLGLTGAVSPLPHEALAQLHVAFDEEAGQDLAAFIGLIQQRLLQLLQEGVNASLLSTSMHEGLGDIHSRQLLQSVAAAEPIDPKARLGAFAALSQPCCNSREVAWAANRELRRLRLDTQVVCEPFTGQMSSMTSRERWTLGRNDQALGQNAMIGDSAPNPAGKVTLILGPVSRPWLQRWRCMVAQANQSVREIVQAALAPKIKIDVVMLVNPETLGCWRLGATPDPSLEHGGLLGIQTSIGRAKALQHIFWPNFEQSLPGLT